MDDSKAAAEAFLKSLLSKTLRITTSDTRLFVGEFKCTDADRNIILSRTYEYRLPSTIPSAAPLQPPSEAEAEAGAAGETNIEGAGAKKPALLLDLTSRYLGLVVVPGEFITKIEVEEFASQVKSRGGESKYAALARAELGAVG